MQKIYVDPYVFDVLMPDLVGHDKRPAAFVVYLFLLTASSRLKRDVVGASLQTISTKTGLSKSTVQNALRHLRNRGLIDSDLVATSTQPLRRILCPWRR
jgi:DNA-binding transcriptional ArsR family regulator